MYIVHDKPMQEGFNNNSLSNSFFKLNLKMCAIHPRSIQCIIRRF